MKRRKLLALKELPPAAIREPIKKRVRAASEHAQRTTLIFVIILCVAFAIWLFAEFTGNATMNVGANITDSVPSTCDISLYPGMNIISLYCVSNAQSLAGVLNQTDIDQVVAIYEYRPESSDRWRVYNPNLPSYVVNDLSSVSRHKGYVVILDNDAPGTSVYFSGILAASSTIPLLQYNNLAGYPSLDTLTLPAGLTTIADTVVKIRTYNTTDGWIEYNITHNNTGGLDTLTPGRGYWITLSASDSWFVVG